MYLLSNDIKSCIVMDNHDWVQWRRSHKSGISFRQWLATVKGPMMPQTNIFHYNKL